MSVLIKGMKMPESCGKCFVGNRTICKNGCPLIALPKKHGRLIDADELKKEFPKDTDWEYPVNTNEYVCEMIDNANAVIEAEDG